MKRHIAVCVDNTLSLLFRLTMVFLAVMCTAAAVCGARAARVEYVSFPANVTANAGEPILKLVARLYLPERLAFPVAAVVITPSSGGVKPFREVHYAEALAEAGIAALVIDSFASRGHVNSVYDQRILTRWQAGNDAVAGLRWLTRDERFKPDRIGVLGVSKGGLVALDSAIEVRRRWMRADSVKFAAHVALSPGCQWVNRSTITTGAPILLMLAEFDDMAPAQTCQRHADYLRQGGAAAVEVKVYAGAHHAWEAITPKPRYDPWAENYSGCRVWIEDDGALTDSIKGESIPRREWYEWAKRTCVKLGAHCCGGTPELKQQATQDMLAFLRKHGF